MRVSCRDLQVVLERSETFHSYETFPSLHQLELIQLNLIPISSEGDMLDFNRDTVENPV